MELGVGKLLPELEDAFQGLKPGESKQVAARFPDDFGNKDLAGRNALFDCKLVELKKKVLPALDDALAAQLREGGTLEGLKIEIRESIYPAKAG